MAQVSGKAEPCLQMDCGGGKSSLCRAQVSTLNYSNTTAMRREEIKPGGLGSAGVSDGAGETDQCRC